MADKTVVVSQMMTGPKVDAPFCPFCGARIAEWGHDDNCPRPEGWLYVPLKGTRRAEVTGGDRDA